MAPGVYVTSFRIIVRSEFNRFLFTPIASVSITNVYANSWSQNGNRFCSQVSNKKEEKVCSDEVSVEFVKGLRYITVPLPSRNEKCRFALKPVSHKVGDFIEMLRIEDRGIDRAAVLNNEGIRIASTCSIESLMDKPFWLLINDERYSVLPPPRKDSSEDPSKLDDIRALVAQLYEALHVGEYHIKKEEEMVSKLEDLKYQIQPFEEQIKEMGLQAARKANFMTWFGLGLMSVQFGILARLTWWEYSWDIMEPVTYFVTYGTAMAAYAYFCITKQEYNFPEVKDRQYLLTMHKRAEKKGFDIDNYNNLKREIACIEYDLKRLRDPLNLQLPPHLERSFHGPSSNHHSSESTKPSVTNFGNAAAAAYSLSKSILQTAASKLTK